MERSRRSGHMDQNDTIRFLSEPGSYGSFLTHVERRETHGALVFLAGNRAYKLKRAVRYPYLDYSTTERRRAMCEAELSVNRRTAPKLYLGVKSIVREKNGRLRFGGEGEQELAIDWVVEMRRFDESQLLEEIRKRGALTPRIMRDLADTIAQFHSNAEVRIGQGGGKAMCDVIEENLAVLRDFEARPFPRSAINRYEKSIRREYSRVRDHLDRRSQEGFVRRCHGDLHLNNICLLDDTPVPFDAIEFNDSFSTIDVLYDFAFLL